MMCVKKIHNSNDKIQNGNNCIVRDFWLNNLQKKGFMTGFEPESPGLFDCSANHSSIRYFTSAISL